MKRCTEVLDEINSLLNGFKGTFKDRTNWAFTKKKKAAELVSQLEQCKTTLGLAIINELQYYQFLHAYMVNFLDCNLEKKAKRVLKNVKRQLKHDRKLKMTVIVLHFFCRQKAYWCRFPQRESLGLVISRGLIECTSFNNRGSPCSEHGKLVTYGIGKPWMVYWKWTSSNYMPRRW